MPLRRRRASSSSARPSGSASTRCGCRSSGPATRSRRSAYLAARTSTIRLAHRHRAARRPHAGDARDVGAVAAGAVGRAVRARHRHQRPAGDGGLARRPLRPAGRRTRETIEIIRAITRRASGSSTTARSTSCRCPAARAAASARSMPPAHVPIYVAVARPGQPAAHRRARRRVDRQLVLPRDRRRVPRPDPRGRGRGRTRSLDDLDLTVVGRRRVHRRRRGGRPPPRRGLRVHVRRDGIGDDATSTTTRSPARATATTCARCNACGWPATSDAARTPRADRDRARHQPHRHRRPRPRPAPPLPRRRRHHAARQPPRRSSGRRRQPASTTSAASSTLCATSTPSDARPDAGNWRSNVLLGAVWWAHGCWTAAQHHDDGAHGWARHALRRDVRIVAARCARRSRGRRAVFSRQPPQPAIRPGRDGAVGAAAGIGYVWLRELGGRRRPMAGSKHVALRNDAFRAYADYMETTAFLEGVESS